MVASTFITIPKHPMRNNFDIKPTSHKDNVCGNTSEEDNVHLDEAMVNRRTSNYDSQHFLLQNGIAREYIQGISLPTEYQYHQLK